MNPNKVIQKRTADLLAAIALYHDVTPVEMIKGLIGVAWDEEEAGEIISWLVVTQ